MRMSEDAVKALKKCAEALHLGIRELANSRMKIVLDFAEEAINSETERLIRYFAEALARRAYGLHPKYLSFPFSHWKYGVWRCYGIFGVVGGTISNVIEGKSKVHVIELADHMDIFYQWTDIIFSVYKWGDLRHLRLSLLVQENVEFLKESEEKLIRAAKNRYIELEYKIIPVDSLADIDVSSLEIRRGEEFVVVNCMFVLSKMWEAVAVDKVLLTVRDVIKPDIMIVVEHDHDANHNQSDFLLRFDESLKYYSSLLLEEEYHPVEVELYFKYQICNIVACEGSNRVERHQTRAQWASLLIRYGFSIHYLPTENEDLENGISVIKSAETEKQPLFFVSAWKITSPLFKSSDSNEGHHIIPSESHRLQTFEIFPEDLYLIRMASLAETYDILLNISKQYEVKGFLTLANCARPAYLHDESSFPLKPILGIEDSASFIDYHWLNKKNRWELQLEEGKGYVGKALEYNGPFYVPDIFKSEESVCPYIFSCIKEIFFLGALAIKFSNAYINCGNYVVEFLFPRSNMTLEKQEQLVHCIISDLKNARPGFVTYGNQGPLVKLAINDTAVSNTMLVTDNPLSELTSDFNLKGTNQRVGNAMDVQWPMQQGPDGNAALHTKASIENLVAPPIGDFNLNGRLSLSGINQTTGFLAMDMQRPHKQRTKRRRTSKSDVWDHFEKEGVVDGGVLAKCNYCDFKTDGSSKKGTSHLRKHLESRHRKIKNVHQSSNLPSKNLELQSAFKENFVLDEDKIHWEMAKVVIKYKLPLSIIHDEHLKNLFKMLQPKFEFQSEKDLRPHVLHVYNEEKHKLRRYFDKLSCRFNLTINLWKDDAKGRVNCCLTVQFIDDSWELKKKVLTFEGLENDFGALSWSEIFKKVLSDWIFNEKTCSLTIHNSSNDEVVHDEESWPSSIFYLCYDKCISEINYMAADISLKSIYHVYKDMNHLQNKGYTLMNVERSNDWRICSLILSVVTILHPYLKLKFVQFVYEEIYGAVVAKKHLDEISNFLTSVYDKYANNCTNQTEFTPAIADTSCSSQFHANDKVLDSFRKYLASKPSRLELYQYLEEKECSSMEIDVLKWWQNNSSRFPTMVKMARDFLAIPLSTIVSNSAFISEVKKIVSNNNDQDLKIINAMICCHDWLASVKGSAGNEKCDEKLLRGLRVWSAKDVREYLVWDFSKEDLQLLGDWENHKRTGQLKVQEKFLAPLVIPPVDATIQHKPEDYYIGDEIMNAYFDLLKRRSEENPNMFLKHDYLDSSTASTLLNGGEPSVPSCFTPEKQSNACKLFLPCCLHCHWTLFYVDLKDKKFVWLNSLRGTFEVPAIIEKNIRSWFENALLPTIGLNNARNWLLDVPTDIPKQQNGIDCDIFVMKYADCLTYINCIGFPFSQKDMPHFRKRIYLEIYNGKIHVPKMFVRN